ncbi:MAG: ABC transporter transmembrane domain-containing protein [Geobacteraceae bacterium]|nr:ABC transporter transmembrane domain-containing protein [Geobacteraceae bacterium]
MPLFQRLLNYSRPHWWRIAIAIVATLGVAGLDGAIAYMVEPVLKKIFTQKDMTIFVLLPLGIILLFLVRGICRFTYEYFLGTAGQLAIQSIRDDLYRKNMTLSLGFFHRHRSGSLMSHVLNDVTTMQEGVANVITGVMREGVTAIALLGVVFYRNWQLAVVAFIAIPLTIYPARKIGKRIKRLSGQSLEKLGDISKILQETFSGIKVIKAFGLEPKVVAEFGAVNREFYGFMRRTIKYTSLSTPVMEVITSLGVAAVIWFGGTLVMRGAMTAPEFFSFIAAMVMLYAPVRKLLTSYNVLQRSLGAAERIFEILDEKPEISDRPDSIALGTARGEVRFEDVSFSYQDEYVLRNVNLEARMGEVVALVGPSGGGKTTLVSLISRFYDVSDGRVLIDGIDVRSIRMRDLLRQISLVDQETTLFNDTVANNIRFGGPEASDEEVETVARAAFAHDFIMEMPLGYETCIGDRGVRLSGGQRQRICIARAILKDSPILILDEATSALDTESEQMVQQAINNLMANRTTFVIAHRLSTILHADKIVVLEKGEIVQQGTHQQLLKAGGTYKKLYEMQFAVEQRHDTGEQDPDGD